MSPAVVMQTNGEVNTRKQKFKIHWIWVELHIAYEKQLKQYYATVEMQISQQRSLWIRQCNGQRGITWGGAYLNAAFREKKKNSSFTIRQPFTLHRPQCDYRPYKCYIAIWNTPIKSNSFAYNLRLNYTNIVLHSFDNLRSLFVVSFYFFCCHFDE